MCCSGFEQRIHTLPNVRTFVQPALNDSFDLFYRFQKWEYLSEAFQDVVNKL